MQLGGTDSRDFPLMSKLLNNTRWLTFPVGNNNAIFVKVGFHQRGYLSCMFNRWCNNYTQFTIVL